ncbi:MAG: hypothetical protein R3F59_24115 [Myxococcota bacterium]
MEAPLDAAADAGVEVGLLVRREAGREPRGREVLAHNVALMALLRNGPTFHPGFIRAPRLTA